jgi:hypothetical protein
MVQLVARKLGLMSHDLLREGKKKKKKKTNSTNSFGKYLSWVFSCCCSCMEIRSSKKLIDQEDECEPRCRLAS